jgi:dihydrofolate reductase
MQQSKNLKKVSLIVAQDQNGGIGNKGGLPWPYLSKDMKHFAQMTSSTEPLALS